MNLVQDYFKTGFQANQAVYEETVKDILALAEKRLNKKASQMKVLDVGSGHGFYSRVLASQVKKVVGVEPYIDAHKYAVKHNRAKNVTFHHAMIEDFQTEERFDLALSLTTLEHMPEAEKSYKRVLELLVPGGLIYLTAPNKLWFYDSHYNLLFIRWMPLWMADIYMHLMKRGSSFRDASYSRSYFGIKKLFNKFPCTYEFILPDADAAYVGCGANGFKYRLMKKIGIGMIKRFPLLWIFSKGFILLIQKKA